MGAVTRTRLPTRSLVPEDAWHEFALCRGDRALFFAANGERPERRRRRELEAKQVCARCPVVEICRDEGRRRREHGVWGGETEDERAALGYAPHRASRRLRVVADGTVGSQGSVGS